MEPQDEMVVARPAPPLAALIDRYIGYRQTGLSPGLHRGLPSRHMTFIVSIGPTIDVVAQTDPGQSPASYGCVVGGLQASTALISYRDRQEGVAVELTPLGCRALLRMPAGALWNTSVECADVTGPDGQELWERLQGLDTWPDRFAACDEILSRRVRPGEVIRPELGHTWRALVQSEGSASISALAANVGWSRPYLTRQFGTEFGLRPKLAARVIRFERARRMLQSTPPFVSIAQVAAACGYYDQSHLDRDFAELAGCSPSIWLAEEVPSVQDDLVVEARH